MRINKTQKGITLVALIITLVVLLILAAVAIAAIQNNRIMDQTKSGADEYSEASEEEQITLALNEWTLKKYTQPGTTFAKFMKEKFGADKVTTYGENEVKVTLESGKEYEAKADGTVEEPILIGSYVEYDVSYTDMYQGTTFNSTNGWRYLGRDNDGNKLIVSTGIPMILDYHINTEGENAKWWDTTKTNKNEQVASGMLNNFDKIPYEQVESGTDVATANTAIGRFAASKKIYEGAEYDAVGDYFKVTGKTYSNNITVRSLTFEEVVVATDNARKGESGYTGGEVEAFCNGTFMRIPIENVAYGLFELRDLTGYEVDYEYWLATPDDGEIYLELVHRGDHRVWSYYDYTIGVRAVVEMPSTVQITDTNGDGVFEII